MRKRLRTAQVLVLLCFVLAALAGYIALDRWQRQTIFSIEMGESRWWREPSPRTEVFDISLRNGEKIRAWYIAHDNPEAPTVLYLHGSRWNLNGSAFRIDHWASLGNSVLAIDYRGFGESSARLPSQASMLEDANAALDELKRRQPDPALRFVYGHSLGGAAAVALAAHSSGTDFAGLILESTFTSIRDMIATTRWASVPGMAALVTQPFDSKKHISKTRQALLIIHGTNDSVVPHSMADELLAASGNQESALRRLVKIEGASHSGASRSGPLYDNTIRDFIREVGRPGRPRQSGPAEVAPPGRRG